jgi:NitT/TauT family transport system ATP-binding protein
MASGIEIDRITHRYGDRGDVVLADIGVTIGAGEVTALIGRSGCGKSTLLQIIAGLIQPSRGAVRIDGQTVAAPSRKWNLMFQQPSLFPWMTVFDNAALGLRFAGRHHGLAERVGGLLERLEIAEYADVNVQKLSGGQQQRVALARSLASEPDVLLLDEPLSSLDAFTRAALQADIRGLIRELGITAVLVTHDFEEAVMMADRVVLMRAQPGRIVGERLVDLPDPRRRNSLELQTQRAALAQHFEAVAGPAATVSPLALAAA